MAISSQIAFSLFLIASTGFLAGCQSGSIQDVSTIGSAPLNADAKTELSVPSESAERQDEIKQVIAAQHQRAMDKRNLVPLPGDDPYQWIRAAQDVYGEYSSPGTVFHVTNEGNCGAPNGGCTVQTYDINGNSQSVDIYISPSAIGSIHLLFHEIAHSHGILDECMAEKWAHTVTDIKEWSYQECAPQ